MYVFFAYLSAWSLTLFCLLIDDSSANTTIDDDDDDN